MSKGKKIIREQNKPIKKESFIKKVKSVHIIIALIILLLAGTSIVFGVKYNRAAEGQVKAEQAVDSNLMAVMNQAIIQIDVENMSDEEIYTRYAQNATVCDSALLIVNFTKYSKHDELKAAIKDLGLYFRQLAGSKEKMSEEAVSELSVSYIEMINVLSDFNNSDEVVEKAIHEFSATLNSVK